MFHVNENYQKLPGSYLFSTIAKKVNAYQEANPDKNIIRLGIGDVTQPLAPAIIEAMHKAVDEMGHAETFHGYAPDLGYEFFIAISMKVSTQYANLHADSNEKFYIPDNVYIIGTMNDIDRSVDSFDFACKGRTYFLNTKIKPDFFQGKMKKNYLCFY